MQLLNTLYVTLPDAWLRLDNDTLRVEVERETRLRVPLHHLGAVVCFGHTSLSAPLMHRLADEGIALVLLDDNSRTAAQTVSPNPATISGTLSSKTDTDYYKIAMATGATLSATLTPNASSDYDLYLYNSSGSLLASSLNGTGVADVISRANTGAATTWYLRVRYYSGGTGATAGKYTLQVSH